MSKVQEYNTAEARRGLKAAADAVDLFNSALADELRWFADNGMPSEVLTFRWAFMREQTADE